MRHAYTGRLAAILAIAAALSACGRSAPPNANAPATGQTASGQEIYVAPGESLSDALAGLDGPDAPRVIRLAAADYALRDPLVLGSGQALVGAGQGATRLIAAGRMEDMIVNAGAADEAPDSGVTLRGLTLDCANRAERGVNLQRVDNLTVVDVEVTQCRFEGLRISGQGRITNGAIFADMRIHHNRGAGMIVMWAMRGVQYSNITARSNGGRGITFDHSEFQASNILSCDNGGDGIFLRNFFSSNLTGLYSCRNGRNGILATGLVSVTGSGWIAQGNSRSEHGAYDEIRIMGGDLSYGATRETFISGVTVGAYGAGYGQATARHGVFVADGASPTLEGVIHAPTLDEPLCDQCAFDEEVR